MTRFLVLSLIISGVAYALIHWRTIGQFESRQLPNGNVVRASDLRVPGEIGALVLGLALLGILFIGVLQASLAVATVIIVLGVIWIKVRQGQLLGQSLKVTAEQLPQIHQAAEQAAAHLCMPMPDVFVVQNPVLNAYALGFLGRKSVVLHSAVVESMSQDELTSVIGHEFTHIKCLHTHWLVFTNLKDAIRIPLLSDGLGLLLLRWSRKAEYTCDRGGLLASGNLNAVVAALCKVAVGRGVYEQMNYGAFQAQGNAISHDDIARLAENFSSHPYIVHRIRALHEFSRSAYYQNISKCF